MLAAASLFATPWKPVEKLSHEKQQLETKRERSDVTSSIGELNPDEISSSLQARGVEFPAEEKTDETSWLEEEHSFWKERQDWLVEMEREFHAEPSLANREEILKKVAALITDAEEAEKDLREAASEELQLKVEVEAKSSFAQTIEAIQETVFLGKLLVSSYNDLSKGASTEQVADSKGVSTSQFADKVANCGTAPFAPKQTAHFASHHQTIPFWRKATRAAKALVAYLAASSTFPQQTLSSVRAVRSLGMLRGLGSFRSIYSLGAASFFLSRFPGSEAREEYFSPAFFSSFPNLTTSDFQHLNLTSPHLIPYSFSPSSLPLSLTRESHLEQRYEQDIILR